MIDRLEFLITLAKEQHFGHAAEVLGVSQPTLSAGIKQLEDQYGVMLVKRGSRFQGLTPEGERLLEWARRIVGDVRAMLAPANAGFIVPAGDALPLAAALAALLADPPLRERLGRANRQRAEAEFDQESMFTAWHALLSGTLAPAAPL